MITRIEVSGFKTLSNFTLDFKPGLNILIGPNGSGKTNLVSFFEFLAHLVESEASEATSRVGGAGAVFRRLSNDRYERTITVKLNGCVRIPPENLRAQPTKKKRDEAEFILYEYKFELQFPEPGDAVLFSTQSLKASSVTKFICGDMTANSPTWQVDVQSSLDADGVPKATVNKIDPRFLDMHVGISKNDKDNSKRLEDFLTAMLVDNRSLITLIPRFSYDFWLVATDISAGRVYNIVPSRIKLPEDSAKPPGIDRDGSGLSATLYAIQRSKDPEEFSPWPYYSRPRRHRGFGPSSLDQLRSFLRVVNSSIENFYVYNDPFDNQLRVRFDIHSGDYHASVPLALMSDGTLKWIALVTAALTTRSVFSIEEPENYLHPQMQGQLVGILREILFRDDEFRMTLMTTHSETLLNQCTPEELVIVGMENGTTTAIRCQNTDEVAIEIQRTGFGLGYYYVSNALQNL